MPLRGLEQTPENAGKTHGDRAGGAQSGALSTDLRRVIDAWPSLPEHIRRAVLAVIAAAGD
jgi:hypothetical protein